MSGVIILFLHLRVRRMETVILYIDVGRYFWILDNY